MPKEDEILRIHRIICLTLVIAFLASPAWAQGCGTWIMRGGTEYHYDPGYERAKATSTGHAAATNPASSPKETIGKDAVKEKEAALESDEKTNQTAAAINQTEEAINQTDAATNQTAGATNEKAPLKEDIVIEDPVADLAGDWKVMIDTMIDGQNKQEAIDLILIQTDDRLQGYGTVLKKGSDLSVTATGHISDDSVSLNVKEVGQNKEYRLDLDIVEDGMNGSYKIYEEGNMAGNGNAAASRSGL